MARSVVDLLCDLVRIPSVNPLDGPVGPGVGEAGVAAFLAEELGGRGFEVRFQEVAPGRSNVVGRLRGAAPGPRLMLAGHMDTVPGGPAPRVEGGCVHGRGACDMKAALAAYLAAADAVRPRRGELLIAGVVDEEHRMLGAKHIGAVGPWVDWILIGEPTDLRVCICSRGRVLARVRTRGRAAHSSFPERGDSAIYRMAPVLAALERHAAELQRRPGLGPLPGPRLNVGRISGGGATNVVPDECVAEIDRRTLPGETVAGVVEELRAALAGTDGRVEEPHWDLRSFETDPDLPLVVALRDALEAEPPTGFPAGTDAPYFGSPVVLCGPGSLDQAHTEDESVPIEQVERAARAYAAVIEALLG
jgi:acetylornithine deacetylase/succinyl-diaminopimelate desuccinylase-like protein